MKLFNIIKHYLKYLLYYLGILKRINKNKFEDFHMLIYKNQYSIFKEKERVKKIPRFVDDSFYYKNTRIFFVDSASFLFMFNEIFEKEIYFFKTTVKDPKIIDCGANIGLSVLFFNEKFKNAQIVAFEPDLKIFKVLEKNISHLDNISIINKAVWNKETIIKFQSDGADGGRIDNVNNNNSSIVETARLKDYLNEQIDFLKIDIEGAETIVLKDCENHLSNVNNIFIEYHSFTNQEQTLQEILSILTINGFRYYIERVGVVFNKPYIENKNSFDFDLQLNIFGYRL